MKRDKIIYLVITGLFSLMIAGGAVMYFVKYPMVAKTITKLGYPTYIIYPLAIVKILGLIAIWTNLSRTLKEWAYAGFFFELCLAVSAHVAIQDGEFAGAAVALALVTTSYFFNRRLEAAEKEAAA